MSTELSRRRAIRSALALIASSAVPRIGWSAGPRFVAEPFTLGVASGWPTPNGISLWTRLAPAPLAADGGMTPEPVSVSVEIADDEAFSTIVATRSAAAYPELAHSVHVDVDGLAPGRWYHYRFHAGDAVSPTGRTRTADAPGAAVSRLRFAIGSCQHLEQGWYPAHRHLADEDLDLMVFLGDYMYESSWGEDLVRRYLGGEAATLADYRLRYAQHRTDRDLQRLHGAVPWLTTWDDHEVDNDWAGTRSEHLDPAFLQRRAAAFQAYVEHFPLPRSRMVGPRMYDQTAFGDLVRFCVLDDRQYRSPQPCPDPVKGGGSTVFDAGSCPELDDPARTLLGAEQEAWLDGALAATTQRWNVLAQQTRMVPVDADPSEGRQVWTDGWDGYPQARRRLLGALKKRKVGNPVVVGGDIHATCVADLHADPADPKSPNVATEFCGTFITSAGMSAEESAQTAATNPHLGFVDGWHRGYVAFEVTPASCTVRVRAVDPSHRDAGVETLATFTVGDGHPTAVRSA